MKHGFSTGLLLVVAFFLFAGCSKENVMERSSPVNHLNEVELSVFKQSIETLPSRAAGTPLSSTNLFSELEVAMIPVDNVSNIAYSARQNASAEDFGNVKLYVPTGNYYLVAVAANTANPSTNHQIDIKSNTEVVFPDDMVKDMASKYQKVSITGTSTSTAIDVELERKVACFHLVGVDKEPSNAQKYEITFSGDVGYVFDPSTGFCKTSTSFTRSYDISKAHGKTVDFTIYTLLSEGETSNVTITAKALDGSGNEIKKLTFENVHMLLGKRTTYQGPLFTASTSGNFTITQTVMEEEGAAHVFE